MTLDIKPGCRAVYQGFEVTVREAIGHDKILIDIGEQGLTYVTRSELLPFTEPEKILGKSEIALIPREKWNRANLRAQAVRTVLAASDRTAEVKIQAKALDISERQFWRLVKIQECNPGTTSMIPCASGRKVGAKVLLVEVERIITEKIEEHFLVPEQPTVQALVERIATACREANVPAPHAATVRSRLKAFDSREFQSRRLGSKKAKYLFEPMPGHVETSAPLERVEIDHTPLDVMVRSDDPCCDYVGRPWLTVAIDVYSRCVLGIHIGFEPPSVLSVALCLSHAMLPKDPAQEFNVPLEWPMHGTPKEIMVDNGKDFVSEAFRRACDEFGILLSFRPVGSPHYGGTIERLIGTLVGQCHLLPGTTKNSVKAKGDYDSMKHASMTLSEVRTWFVEQLLGRYHLREHRMLRIPPLTKWNQAQRGEDDALTT